MYCVQSGADAMPVCFKSEPRKASAAQPPSSQTPTSNGASPPQTLQAPTTTTTNNNSSSSSTNSSIIISSGMWRSAGPSLPVSLPVPPMAGAASSAPSVPHTNGATGGTAGADKDPTAAPVPEDAIDYDSVRGVFGWATLDDINVPYIFRKGKRFVAVRIVEKKVLNKYPNSFPDELGRKEPLVSYFVTEAEATLLNEINTVHCSFEYGHQPFTTKDLIVDLVEFEDFYKLVKKTFPENVLAAMTAADSGVGVGAGVPVSVGVPVGVPVSVGAGVPVSGSRRASGEDRKGVLSKVCGWMQINNTVTPYILRALEKYVPLSVIQYAAQLLTKEQVEGHLPTAEECELLNETCRAAGFDFTFGRNTKLLHITEIRQRCQVKIFDLPFDNPLQHAQYIDSLSQGEGAGGQPSPILGPAGMGGMSLPFQSRPVLSEGPPNLNPFNHYNPFMSMMNMISQSPVSVSNHMHSRTPQQMAPKTMTARPQPSLVRTQTAPIFYPPGASASQSRGSQINNTSVMSQTLGLVPGAPSKTSVPSAGGAIQGLGSPSAQGRMGAPVGSSLPGQMQGHRNIPSPGQLPHVSSPSTLPRLPPPNYLGASPLRQPLTHPPISSPPVHRGNTPHPYITSPHLPTEALSRVGYVPRGTSPAGGFPPGVIPPGGMPPHLGGPQAQPSPKAPRPHPQPPLGPPYHPSSQLPPRAGAPSQMSGAALSHAGVPPSHPSSPFPAHMNPMGQHTAGAGRLPGMESASKTGTVSSQTYATDEHLKLVMDIKAEMVNGKSISCLNRNCAERRGSFCLVEAVAKLYFPKCSLAEFVNALQNVLGISLPVCTDQEAKAFIHFYNLPVAKLNDNHMISLPDLKNYFPQISYMFQHAATDAASMSGLFLTSGGQRSLGADGSTKLASPSAPITVVLNSADSAEVIDIDSGPPTPISGSPGSRNSAKRRAGEVGLIGGKQGRPSADHRILYRVPDEVDGHVRTLKAGVSQPSATSQVIVID
ncbi:hypothetical protein ACOMHN_012175 [Nucella lapillus]